MDESVPPGPRIHNVLNSQKAVYVEGMNRRSLVQRAVERFGQGLELEGIPRMPARVFAFMMIGGQDSYSSRDLARGLEVSAAAISGAVRYLVDARLVLRERAPRGRGDLLRLMSGDIWAEVFASRLPLIDQINASIDDAVAILDDLPEAEKAPGLANLRETREFFEFVRNDMPRMLVRWAEHKANSHADSPEVTNTPLPFLNPDEGDASTLPRRENPTMTEDRLRGD